MNVVKWFGVLVSSGNGQRCNLLKKTLYDELYQIDFNSGKSKLESWKFESTSSENMKLISKSIGSKINPLFKDIPDYFFSIDIGK